MTSRERDAAVAAVVDVCERGFFAIAEPAGAGEGDEVPIDGGWFEAGVSFDGPFAGSMRLALPASLGRELCAAFAGCEPDEIADDRTLEDVVGEFANMACGAWLTRTTPASCFTLAHPEVEAVASSRPEATLRLAVNGQPVIVHIIVGAAA